MKKRRFGVLVIVLIMLLSTVSFTAFADDGETERMPANFFEQGDVNGDEKVNIKDVTLIQKFIANICELSDEEIVRANVDGRGKLDIKDATHLQRWLAKLEDTLFAPHMHQSQNTATDDEPVRLPFIVAD